MLNHTRMSAVDHGGLHCRLFFLVITLLLGGLEQVVADDGSRPELLRKHCTQCHGLGKVDKMGNDRNEIQQVVNRMQGYAQKSDAKFDDNTKKAIVDLLVNRKSGNNDTEKHEPSEGLLSETAATLGFLTALAIAVAIVTGFARSKLGSRFRVIHRTAVIIAGLGLIVHSPVLLQTSGFHGQYWHICGFLAGLCFAVAICVRLFRKQLKKKFLPIHISSALLCALLLLCHRLLAFL